MQTRGLKEGQTEMMKVTVAFGIMRTRLKIRVASHPVLQA